MGRYRNLPGIENKRLRGHLERAAINTPIQAGRVSGCGCGRVCGGGVRGGIRLTPRPPHGPHMNLTNTLNQYHTIHGVHTHTQGGAADVVMMAMLNIQRSQKLRDLGWTLLLQVGGEGSGWWMWRRFGRESACWLTHTNQFALRVNPSTSNNETDPRRGDFGGPRREQGGGARRGPCHLCIVSCVV